MMARRLAPFAALRADDRGATAIEFAMITPVLVTLLVATIVFGNAFYTLSSVQWAMEETSRLLMLDGSLSEAQYERRLNALLGDINGMTIDVTFVDVNYGTEDDPAELPVTRISADVSYPIEIPFVDGFTIDYTVQTEAPRPIN
ncbi:hypothetical protein DDZ18_01860 [Marinicauda salina]|uniref:TadE-like domain-containing protein n=2 Tax=Marinicauda salina TaxID=2135793 RepID=A0A2U2BWH9_9PROT|nr:hypothetical protein DDZ18_01860 [Marinicauda salina]